MKYEKVRRKVSWEEYAEDDPEHLNPIEKSEMRWFYEWESKEAVYRVPPTKAGASILDRRRNNEP